jgi:hypothetical protein
MPNHATVLPFPRPMSVGESEQKRAQLPAVLAWFRCVGGCGAFVTSAGAWCLHCAVEDQ